MWGDEQFDAILAASAEYVACHNGVPVPVWARDDSRTLDRAWMIPEYRQAQVWARIWAPAALNARGIFIEKRKTSQTCDQSGAGPSCGKLATVSKKLDADDLRSVPRSRGTTVTPRGPWRSEPRAMLNELGLAD